MHEALQALLRLVKAGTMVTVAAVMSVMAILVLSLRLHLVKPQFFLLIGAATVLLSATWLWAHGHTRMAKLFAFGATFTVVSIVVQARFPGLFDLGQSTAQALNERGHEKAAQLETPQETACEKPFFVGPQGNPRLWYAPGRQACFVCRFCSATEGFDPDTREKLQPITPDIVSDIQRHTHREQPAAPVAVVIPPPTTVPPAPKPPEWGPVQHVTTDPL